MASERSGMGEGGLQSRSAAGTSGESTAATTPTLPLEVLDYAGCVHVYRGTACVGYVVAHQLFRPTLARPWSTVLRVYAKSAADAIDCLTALGGSQ